MPTWAQVKTATRNWQSSRAISPPWPGMNESKSLSLYARLIALAMKPPKGATTDAKAASTTRDTIFTFKQWSFESSAEKSEVAVKVARVITHVTSTEAGLGLFLDHEFTSDLLFKDLLRSCRTASAAAQVLAALHRFLPQSVQGVTAETRFLKAVDYPAAFNVVVDIAPLVLLSSSSGSTC